MQTVRGIIADMIAQGVVKIVQEKISIVDKTDTCDWVKGYNYDVTVTKA